MTATKVQESLERLFDVTDPNKGGMETLELFHI